MNLDVFTRVGSCFRILIFRTIQIDVYHDDLYGFVGQSWRHAYGTTDDNRGRDTTTSGISRFPDKSSFFFQFSQCRLLWRFVFVDQSCRKFKRGLSDGRTELFYQQRVHGVVVAFAALQQGNDNDGISAVFGLFRGPCRVIPLSFHSLLIRIGAGAEFQPLGLSHGDRSFDARETIVISLVNVVVVVVVAAAAGDVPAGESMPFSSLVDCGSELQVRNPASPAGACQRTDPWHSYRQPRRD
mmetsp:Transcript_12054/g.22386  ORF Transcript_12054/g.22386 Transcript_12054/m.22386 type:complete len:241 (+) Transcript_12054:700-1422(+)